MKIVHAIFAEELSAAIDEDGNIVFGNGEAVVTPLQALKTDPAGYKSEFLGWFHDVWLTEHRQVKERLLRLHDNRARFADLCRAVSSGTLIPFVGSGMSKPSQFPLWREFLHNLRSRTTMSEAELDELLSLGEYEEAADRLRLACGENAFNERIEHGLRVSEAHKIIGAVRLLPELFDKLIVTTNLDDVLEYVYEAAGKTPTNMLLSREIERYRRLRADGESCLIKLHGHYRWADGRVLGVREYEDAYAPGSSQREALSLIYRNHPLLWLGCSLTIDRTVRLVRELAGVDAGVPRHFAFMRMPEDDAQLIARERELTDLFIHPIWYEGEDDECITALLVGLLENAGRFAEMRDTWPE